MAYQKFQTEFDEQISNNYQELWDASVPNHSVRQVDQPWKSAKKVRVHFFWGDRGSGKSNAMESTAEEYYNEGLNVWHIWGARSYENLFWAVNRNCERKWH